MPDQRSLWDLLDDIVQQRDKIMVDEEGEIIRLGELDELSAARHIKRLVTQWGNRRRGRGAPSPLPGQTELEMGAPEVVDLEVIGREPTAAPGDERTPEQPIEPSPVVAGRPFNHDSDDLKGKP